MTIRTELTLAILLATAFLVSAFGANANAAEYQQAEFKAEIKGVQTFQSEYHVAGTGACSPSIDESTTEKVRFKSTKPVKLTVTKIPQVRDPVLTSGTKALRIPTTAKVTRSHSSSAGPVGPDCADNGGGVTNVTPPDCGTRTVKPLWMSVDYYKRGHVELQPEDNAGSDPFQMCGGGAYPFILSGAVFGKRQDAELPEDEVFDEKIGKLITIGQGDEFLPFGDNSYEDTKIRWELSLTRIKK